MPIEGDDWWYVAGAGAAGLGAGALLYHLFSPEPGEIFTGLGRRYKFVKKDGPSKDAAHMMVSIWVDPSGRYRPRFEVIAPWEEPLAEVDIPDIPSFPWPAGAALWADDIMARMDYVPITPWAHVVNEAAREREKERPKEMKPAMASSRRTKR
jgi:hypothetical protein